MTSFDPKEVERIAEGLSAAPRAALIGAHQLSGPCADYFASPLTDDSYDPDLMIWPTGRLTPLGLAVRHHLQERSS